MVKKETNSHYRRGTGIYRSFCKRGIYLEELKQFFSNNVAINIMSPSEGVIWI